MQLASFAQRAYALSVSLVISTALAVGGCSDSADGGDTRDDASADDSAVADTLVDSAVDTVDTADDTAGSDTGPDSAASDTDVDSVGDSIDDSVSDSGVDSDGDSVASDTDADSVGDSVSDSGVDSEDDSVASDTGVDSASDSEVLEDMATEADGCEGDACVTPCEHGFGWRDGACAPLIVVLGGPLETRANGGTATFTIALAVAPSAAVTIVVSSSDTTEGHVSPQVIRFEAGSTSAQTLAVTGVDDHDENPAYMIVTAPAVSADLAFDGVDAQDVVAANQTGPDVYLEPVTEPGEDTTLTTSEDGDAAQFTFALAFQPTEDVVFTFTSSDPTLGEVVTETLVFTPENWSAPQTVTIVGQDVPGEGAESTYVIVVEVSSADPAYDGLAVAPVTVTNIDDEAAGVIVTPREGLVTSEAGGRDTFTVVLQSRPASDVTIALASSDVLAGTLALGTLVFTPDNWGAPQVVTVTGADDPTRAFDVAYTIVSAATSSADPRFHGLEVADVAVLNVDRGTPGVVVDPVDGLITSEGGERASFSVVLASRPTADVVIPVRSSAAGEGLLVVGGARLAETTLTFTALDWDARQIVVVEGVADPAHALDGDSAFMIVLAPVASADPAYGGGDVHPVIDPADVEVVNRDGDSPGLVVSAEPIVTDEAGGTATLTVALATAPDEAVTVSVTVSGGAGEAEVSVATLTFTPENWDVPQTVTVTGVPDPEGPAVVDGDATFHIDIEVVAGDPDYVALGPAIVEATNVDLDAAKLIVKPLSAPMRTSESGGQVYFSVALSRAPSADVAVAVTALDPSELSLSAASLTFTASDWDAQVITVTGVDDAVVDGLRASAIRVGPTTGDVDFAGLPETLLDVDNADDDAAFVFVCPLGTEGDELSGCRDIDACVAFGCGDNATCTDTPAPALGGPGGRACACVPGFGGGDCVPLIQVVGGPLETTANGGTATFTIALGVAPTAPVTIVVSSSDTTEGQVSPQVVTFEAGSTEAQTITVTGVDDHDNNPTFTIVTAPAVSADLTFAGVDARDIDAANRTGPDVNLEPLEPGEDTTLTTSEDGGVAQLTFALAFPPTDDVVFTFTSSDPTLGTVATETLVFTPENWSAPQTVTIVGNDVPGEDPDPSNATYVIEVAVSSADPAYDDLPVEPVTVTNIDDESPGVIVTPTEGLRTSEVGGRDTFTVVLQSRPASDVTIALMSSDPLAGSVVDAIVFTPDNWSAPQTVTVIGVDDPPRAFDVAYTIVSAASVSADPRFHGLVVADVAVLNVDRGTPGVVVDPIDGLITSESGERAAFSVVLASRPTAAVTIAVRSSDAAEGALVIGATSTAETTLTFTPLNWDARQIVVVEGVADPAHALDGDRAFMIVLAPVTSADPVYGGGGVHPTIDPDDVEVVNRDGDSPGLVVSTDGPLVTDEAGGTATVTVVLATAPDSPVTVSVTASGDGEVTLSETTLTFTPENWDVPQVVTVTGVPDPEGPALVDGDATFHIDVEVVAGDPDYVALGPTIVPATNVDLDAAKLIVRALSAPMRTSESGGQVFFSVALSRAPTTDVHVALAALQPSEGSLSAASLTFTASDWDAQVVTVTGVNDSLVDGLQASQIRIGPVTGDIDFAALPEILLDVDNTDDDAAAVFVCPTGTHGDELSGCNDIDACLAFACGGNATCTDLAAPALGAAAGRTCACLPGFGGNAVTGCVDVDACAANACGANAACTDLAAPAGGDAAGRTCACLPGFAGDAVSGCVDVDACATNACGANAACTDLAAPSLARTCACLPGFGGDAVSGCVDVDACVANACGVNATCTDIPAPALGNAAGRTCACQAGFGGNAVSGCVDLDACATNACGANATCTDLAAPAGGDAAGRTCACNAGFAGNAVSGCVDVDACAANACGANATCTDLAAPALGDASGRTCACDAGFAGNAVTGCVDVDACATNACGSNATCTDLAAPALGNAAGRTCACNAGFGGNALIGCGDIDACVANACGSNTTCSDLPAPALGDASGRTCACNAGFAGDPATGCSDIDACASNACGSNATCTDLPAPALGTTSGRTCACDTGFAGDPATGCDDIDACATNACGSNATCTDKPAPALGTAAGRTCACDAGFDGNPATGCDDIDACATSACGVNASCTDLVAPAPGDATGRTCACDAGFEGDAVTGCVDIDACATNACGANASCTDQAAPSLDRACVCLPGFSGNPVTGCVDIDACATNACGTNASCTDKPAPALDDAAGRTCSCDVGFTGDPLTACSDINACVANACGANATCSDNPAPALNDAAGRTCSCNTGFGGNAQDLATGCVDLDACIANACGNNATCSDKPAPALDDAAGRTCACNAGFSGNPVTGCVDIDACATNACGTNASCSDKPAPALDDAAGRTCSCNAGFGGNPAIQCSDIDACVDNACGNNATCSDKPAPALNDPAGRTCACNVGFGGNAQTGCTDLDACTLTPCGSNTNCADAPAPALGDATGRTCSCRVGFAGDPATSCNDIDACLTNACGGNATCTDKPAPALNGPSDRTCACSTGYEGDPLTTCTDIDACPANGCGAGNACTDLPAPALGDATGRTCSCAPGFATDPITPANGCVDIDACYTTPCGSNTDCADLPAPATGAASGRTCACKVGFAGDPQTSCTDIDACLTHACGTNTTCTDHPAPALATASDRTCACNPGFGGDPLTACTNIDACLTHACGPNSACVDAAPPAPNSAAGRTCPCLPGYEGDGTVAACSDIDACAYTPCTGDAVCADDPAPADATGRTCTCPDGFLYDAVLGCVDVDECATQASLCDAGVSCMNLMGTYRCACMPGTLDVHGDGSECATVVTTAAGGSHSCALTSNGALYCWGDNASGQLGDGTDTAHASPVQVGSATDWLDVAAGEDHTCGRRGTGTLYCWGENGFRQLGDGSSTSRLTPVRIGVANDWSAVTLGQYHSCGLRGGALYCWGFNLVGAVGDGTTTTRPSPVRIGAGNDWTQVAAGALHSCGVRAGALFCWGTNSDGQVDGGPDVPLRTSPTQVGSDTDWAQVSGGRRHTCGLRGPSGQRTLACWGANDRGQLGDGATATLYVPTAIGADDDWSQVAAGGGHTCGRRGDALYCWGANNDLQLGTGAGLDLLSPTLVSADSWSGVSVGAAHTCATSAGVVRCWGNFGGGRVGDGQTLVPLPVGADSDWTQVSAGSGLSCGLRDNTLYCWGGTTTSPTAMSLGWSQVSVGETSACGLRSGTLWCWARETAPAQVGVATDWTTVSVGTKACGLRAGALYCWADGQAPVQVGVESDWSHVEAGGNANYGLRAGVLYAWSLGAPGQLSVHTDWNSLALGHDHGCATRTNGSLYCWGANGSGQLGVGTTTSNYMPQQVGSATDWVGVTAGADHTCALRTRIAGAAGTGTLYCWGKNVYGQVGDGSVTARPRPVQVGATSDWTAVDGGATHSCGLIAGVLACWGDNTAGQLGNAVAGAANLVAFPPGCAPGYRPDAIAGCVDIDACPSNACGPNATCTDRFAPALGDAAGRTCSCNTGYGGDALDPIIGCVELDACLTNACGTNTTCTDLPAPALNNAAGRTCACSAGFEGNPLTACTDINACTTNACGTNASCSDLPAPALNNAAGRTCACNTGFGGNPQTSCTDLNACLTNACGSNATCADLPAPALANPAGRTCGCNAGYSGNAQTGCGDLNACLNNPCIDVSCTDKPAPNPDTPAGRTCGACPTGFTHNEALGCVDNDECALGQFSCNAGAVCDNIAGGYRCICEPGTLDLNGDGTSCSRITKLVSGDVHSCAIAQAGALYCWGGGGGGQLGEGGGAVSRPNPVQVGTASDWIDVVAHGQSTCGRRAGGTLWCWGQNQYGELGNGTTASAVNPTQVGSATGWTDVDLGEQYACGVRGGVLYCWGRNDRGQLGDTTTINRSTPVVVPGFSDWVDVSAGYNHTCALRTDFRQLYCWGDNTYGQLALNNTVSTMQPTDPYGSNWTSISVGSYHTCGVSIGRLFCWGYNGTGQLGDDSTVDRWVPVQIGSAQDWMEVSAVGNSTCGRRFGALYCWGTNNFGQLGDDTTTQRNVPTRVGAASDWIGVSGSTGNGGFTCGLRGASGSGAVACWGKNDLGQLGNGIFGNRELPVRVGTASDWVATSANFRQSCGLRTLGGGQNALYCWGQNSQGQLGDGTTQTRATPTRIGVESDWTQISVGVQTTCGLRGPLGNATLWCWGYNSSGTVGDGTQIQRLSPVQVGTASDWSEVSPPGGSHTCGRRGGALYCWGYGYHGALGTGTDSQLTPTRVGSENDWSSVRAGYYSTCGMRGPVGSGRLYCWGDNDFGQLGNGTTQFSYAPVQVGSDSDWADFSHGNFHTCGRRSGVVTPSDGRIFCWGQGRGPTPVQIGTGADWSHLTNIYNHTCARRGGELYCFGTNNQGQLGLGGTQSRPLPTLVGTLSDYWSDVTGGWEHTCAIRSAGQPTGQLWCWGSNDQQQLGLGATWTPAAVTFLSGCPAGQRRDPQNPQNGCVEMNACVSNPCGTSATCADLPAPALGNADGRTCACPTGFSGNPAVFCGDTNGCVTTPCGLNTTCSDKPAPALGDSAGRTCTCMTGFAGDPATACSDINACATNACGANALCSDKPAPALGDAAGRTCACNAGYGGDPVTGCSNLDACVLTPCGSGASCFDWPPPQPGDASGRICYCPTGTEGSPTIACTNIDACATNPCGANATCYDNPPPALTAHYDRTCACNFDYEGNPYGGCTQIDHCVGVVCPTAGQCLVAGTCNPRTGQCSAITAAADGLPCDDGNACLTIDLCQAGQCQGFVDRQCNDGNSCTNDYCDSALGCRYADKNDGDQCSDNDPCTDDDACQRGACVGAIPRCDDNNPCTIDVCQGGNCSYPSRGSNTLCSDGDPCNGMEQCTGGGFGGTPTCQSGNAQQCPFEVRGTVSGLIGSGLVLRNNAETLTIDEDGNFTFADALPDGANYTVSIEHQPSGPQQLCRVIAGASAIASGHVNDVQIVCDPCGNGVIDGDNPVTRVSFEWITRSAVFTPLPLTFYFNGAPVLTVDGNPYYNGCYQYPDFASVTAPALLANIGDGNNRFGVMFDGEIAWAVATIRREKGPPIEVVIYDAGAPGDASSRNRDLACDEYGLVGAHEVFASVSLAEDCDDGNLRNGDGCSQTCFPETCVPGRDADGDRLPDCVEDDTGVYTGPLRTGTDPNDADTDDDGIEDGDEVLGTENGLNLRALGANPLRKDIFVEIDWFEDATNCALHNHRPTPVMLELAIEMFARAPVMNPDGSLGISLHVDYGQGGAFTGGNLIGNSSSLTYLQLDSAFLTLKAANFADARRHIFHYSVWTHELTSGVGGIAELDGDDFMVGAGIVSCPGFQILNSGVPGGVHAEIFAHELGHNLGLGHGGDSYDGCNNKPNYPSIMNYRTGYFGIDTGCDLVADGVMDFSRGARIPLDELSLNEHAGICGARAIDWNSNGQLQSPLSFDVNVYTGQSGACGGTKTLLEDHDDWSNIRLDSVVFGRGDGPAVQPVIHCY